TGLKNFYNRELSYQLAKDKPATIYTSILRIKWQYTQVKLALTLHQINRTIDIHRDTVHEEFFTFYPWEQEKFPLKIQANPEPARIMVMNIKDRYYPDIELPPGRYDIVIRYQSRKTKKDDHKMVVNLGLNQQTFYFHHHTH
ncbi:hypothetical protein, partial [Endozoicomonas atrinae]|uniref:hypothetical protein n=1 Tax=Endozoicomonas atrinae TaxID=1333660 RepID=UPI001EE6CF98